MIMALTLVAVGLSACGKADTSADTTADTTVPIAAEEDADVNADGVSDLKDVVLIRRFLAGGWDVTLV